MVIFFVVAAVVGIAQEVKERTAELRAAAELKAAEAHRAMVEAQAKPPLDLSSYVLVPVVAFEKWKATDPAGVAAVMAAMPEGAPATDAELKKLRIAGLDEGSGK
jgi:hypothetical protein